MREAGLSAEVVPRAAEADGDEGVSDLRRRSHREGWLPTKRVRPSSSCLDVTGTLALPSPPRVGVLCSPE